MYVQTLVYRIVGTGLDVHTRVYRFARTDLYRVVGTDCMSRLMCMEVAFPGQYDISTTIAGKN